MMRAGTPATTTSGGTLRVTTVPAPTMERAPMRTPGRIMAPAPIHTSSSTTMGLRSISCSRTYGCWAGREALGWESAMKMMPLRGAVAESVPRAQRSTS